MLDQIRDWHRRLQLSDREALGPMLQAQDESQDYLLEDRTYAWHAAIGRALRPLRIGEIGVRFGYALACLAGGSVGDMACDARPRVQLWGWDSECYVGGSSTIARGNLSRFDPTACLMHVDTRELSHLDCPPLDLIHVDGDHSRAGALRDMGLAWSALRPGGVMLVDDYHFIGDVRDAVRAFDDVHRLGYEVLPTFRGTALLLKEEAS